MVPSAPFTYASVTGTGTGGSPYGLSSPYTRLLPSGGSTERSEVGSICPHFLTLFVIPLGQIDCASLRYAQPLRGVVIRREHTVGKYLPLIHRVSHSSWPLVTVCPAPSFFVSFTHHSRRQTGAQRYAMRATRSEIRK